MQAIVTTTAQYNLSQIMSDAWVVVRQAGQSLSDALKMVWAKAKAAVRKLNIDLSKLNELTLSELRDLRAALDSTITEREASEQTPQAPKRTAHHIKLSVEGEKVRTTSYYNSCFVGKARNLRGTWSNGQWVFPISVADHVKAAMLDCYGVTGESPYEVCTLTVKEYSESEYSGGVELFGRPIAKAFGRDSGAKLQDGIVLLSGKMTSGGSVKNWKTVVENATFEIHDFPVAAINTHVPTEWITDGTVAIK